MGPGDEVAKRFRLERPLGSGGMGAVWAATHLVTHKSVALKFLHKKHDDADARRRVLREARASCAVRHPNVVAVHDVVEGEDGTPILVMDLLNGESLAEKLARERTLTPADAVAMVTPLLSALAIAHDVGIVHRDLKPDNVFLVDGLVSNVRILDFGVAKLTGKDAATKETNRLTETGAMIGTPHYMAPEQAFGESDVDARADLYAAGAVLYECLAGVPPTDGHNLGQILKVLASGSIQPLAVRAPSVPAPLAAIVDGLLQIERADRPASARVVLDQLAAVVDAPAVSAITTPSTPIVSPTTKAKRSRASLFAMIASVLLLAGALGFGGIRLNTATAHASAVAPALAPSEPPAPPMTPASADEPAPPVPTAAPAASPVPSARKKLPPRPPAVAASAPRSKDALIPEPTF